MEQRETVENNIADSDIQASSQTKERTEKKNQARKARIGKATTVLDPGETLAGVGSSGRKKVIDAEVVGVTAEYMKRAGGDHMKAAGLWFEREEQKEHEPWAELERGEAFIEAMKKDILDPIALQLQQEEEEEAEEARRSKRKSGVIRRPRPVKRRGGSSSSLQPSVPKAAQEGSLLAAPKKTAGDPEPPLVIPAKQPASLAALEDVEPSSASTSKVTLPPTQPSDQDLPSETPRKRKRSTAADVLESALGKKWEAHVTDDGRRPCTRIRQEKTPSNTNQN